jgi:1-acyl-sn-glycerol-3-phosphate acyltransferase
MMLFFLYLLLFMGPAQRLIVFPLVWLLPRRRTRVLGWWIRLQAWITRSIVSYGAGVRIRVSGTTVRESCIVVMNHQSVLDIPIGLRLVPGPYPLIPTRDRYQWGVPGISPLARLARYPFVSQKRVLSRSELAALTGAAEQVARGEQSLLIFPEGHRSRDGGLGRFMRSGLRIILSRAERPVYCVAVHGMVNARTFADGLANFANLDIRIAVSDAIAPPPRGSDEDAVDAFIDSLRQRMSAMLAELDSQTRTGRGSTRDAKPAFHS